MKKSLLLLPIALLSVPFITGCSAPNNGEYKLTFGSYIDETFTNLTYSALEDKINQEENFILVTYPGADSTCSCWIVFEMVIERYIPNNVEIIYGVDVFQILGKNNDFNLSLSTSAPSIAFFKNGKLKEQISYLTKNPQNYFKDVLALSKLIDEKTEEPEIIYVNQTYLDNAASSKEDFVILHTYSSCPDCSYCIPNVIAPYAINNDLETDIWIIDLNDIKPDATLYQNYKDKWNLSTTNNSVFGYNNGYVPTAQAYENGVLVDAAVYFNDTIALVNNEYVIIDSFYTSERLPNLKYAANVTTNVLKDMVIPNEQIMSYNDGQYLVWSQEYANIYHRPLLEAFLTEYTK